MSVDWRPGPAPSLLARRARMLARIRDFFAERTVLEVNTPLITPAGITDIHIDSLALANGAFLRTSPEFAHKRLLAAGLGDLYELGPVFRAGEHGRLHRSEFTLLEWYRLGWSWRSLADEVCELIRHAAERALPVRLMAWQDCFKAMAIDPLSPDAGELRALSSELPEDCDSDQRLDFLFATRVQPRFPTTGLTVIHDYPASQAALARLKPGDPRIAERFEVFWGGIELANGYRELTDAGEQRRRFEADNRRRRQLGRREMPIDEAFLAALEAGMPDCAGVAMGVDRLLMAATGVGDIGEVLIGPPTAAR